MIWVFAVVAFKNFVFKKRDKQNIKIFKFAYFLIFILNCFDCFKVNNVVIKIIFYIIAKSRSTIIVIFLSFNVFFKKSFFFQLNEQIFKKQFYRKFQYNFTNCFIWIFYKHRVFTLKNLQNHKFLIQIKKFKKKKKINWV